MTILLQDIYIREMTTYIHTKIYKWMFTAALFVKAKNWKWSSAHQQMNG